MAVSTSTEVYAFRTQEEIDLMINVLDKHIEDAENFDQRQTAYRNKLLFFIGINVGIRASDLRLLRWNHIISNIDGNGNIIFKKKDRIQPQKTKETTGKYITLFYNANIERIIKEYLSEYEIDDLNEYIFRSRKGNDPIAASSLWRIIKNTALEAGIEQNIGSHSLRKTFGYWYWHDSADKEKALTVLQECFGHSPPAVTRRYIGLMEQDIEEVFMGLNFILG